MNSKYAYILLGGIFLFFSESAIAQPNSLDGNTMLANCRKGLEIYEGQTRNFSASDYSQADRCASYLLGFIDGNMRNAAFVASVIKGKQATEAEIKDASIFCIPNNVTMNQLLRIFVKYLEDHPNILHYSAGSLLLSAMLDAFPCQKHGDK